MAGFVSDVTIGLTFDAQILSFFGYDKRRDDCKLDKATDCAEPVCLKDCQMPGTMEMSESP